MANTRFDSSRRVGSKTNTNSEEHRDQKLLQRNTNGNKKIDKGDQDKAIKGNKTLSRTKSQGSNKNNNNNNNQQRAVK